MTDLALSRIATQPIVSHAEMANAIRFLAIDAVENAKSGRIVTGSYCRPATARCCCMRYCI